MARKRRKRRKNPGNVDAAYNYAIGYVADEFEKTSKKVIATLYKRLGKDNDLVKDAFYEGFKVFKDDRGL